MKNAKSFYKKLKKLIEKDIPDNVKVCYDYNKAELYVCYKDAKFFEGHKTCGGSAIPHSINTAGCWSSDTGNDKNRILGYIDVDMQASQN